VSTNLSQINHQLEIASELGVGPVPTPRDVTPASQSVSPVSYHASTSPANATGPGAPQLQMTAVAAQPPVQPMQPTIATRRPGCRRRYHDQPHADHPNGTRRARFPRRRRPARTSSSAAPFGTLALVPERASASESAARHHRADHPDGAVTVIHCVPRNPARAAHIFATRVHARVSSDFTTPAVLHTRTAVGRSAGQRGHPHDPRRIGCHCQPTRVRRGGPARRSPSCWPWSKRFDHEKGRDPDHDLEPSPFSLAIAPDLARGR
jgi:hypothetical protein